MQLMTIEVGKIIDFISGTHVNAGPEEIEATQPFAKKLVNDYGYKKSQITTWPQFRCREAPSGKEKYPVDIVVFNDENKNYNNVYMVVECKAENEQTGLQQLYIYLNMIPSVQLGVWFNGKEHHYYRRVIKEDIISWEEIPDIPRNGESINDIGKNRRHMLKPPTNLRTVFTGLRNYLAGNAIGVSKDDALAEQTMYLLFCKLYDEINKAPDELMDFRISIGESEKQVRKRIESLFASVKKEYPDVFDSSDKIILDDKSIAYVVGEIQKYCISESERDVLGDSFEVFLDSTGGSKGQFFTPRNVVKMIVEMIDPKSDQKIIDPACGSGGFLVVALTEVWRKITQEGKTKGWDAERTTIKKKDVASKNFVGIDKESFLVKTTKAIMAIMGDGKGHVFCTSSLLPMSQWKSEIKSVVEPSSFDIVLTNPPFGKKIPIKEKSILETYDLGFKWKQNRDTGVWTKSTTLATSRPPQILFIERCLNLLKPGGKMGIVLPDSILGNSTNGFVRQYILSLSRLLAVVDLPVDTFNPNTPTKTSVLLLQKRGQDEDAGDDAHNIFMAKPTKCGHTSLGKPITVLDENGNISEDSDFPDVSEAYLKFSQGDNGE